MANTSQSFGSEVVQYLRKNFLGEFFGPLNPRKRTPKPKYKVAALMGGWFMFCTIFGSMFMIAISVMAVIYWAWWIGSALLLWHVAFLRTFYLFIRHYENKHQVRANI